MRTKYLHVLLVAATALVPVAAGCNDDETGLGGSPSGTGGGGGVGGGTAVTPDSNEVDVRLMVRGLFEDRVSWTRFYAVSAVGGLDGTDEAVSRLMKNGEDFGAAIAPFYGEAAGQQLTTLMNDAVGLAGQTLDAALANDTPTFNASKAAWQAKADEVANLLAGANPAWQAEDVSMLLRACIDAVIAEAGARMTGDFAADLEAFEAHKQSSFALADALAGGLATQFPEKVGPLGTSSKEEALRIGMRELFFDRATFVHGFLTDVLDGLASKDTTAQRLMKNNQDIASAIAPFYGQPAADQLRALLDAGLTDAVAAAEAAKAGDMAAMNSAVMAWHEHADETAVFLAGANPNWPVDALKTMLNACVDDAMADAQAIMGQDDSAVVATQGALITEARAVAEALGKGVAAQFP